MDHLVAKGLAFGRQLHRARGTVKKHDPKLFLQTFDVAGDGRLLTPHQVRGLGHASLFSNRIESPQPLQ